jgi:hypothetical protein
MNPLRTIAVALTCGCATWAHADQVVTLRVPVTLQNLHPEVAKLGVGCYITPAGAYDRTDVPVVNRAFNGVVEVKVAVTDAQSLSATGYKCALVLHPASGPGWWPLQASSAPPQAQAKAGTPFKVAVEGPLPPVGSGASVVSPSAPVLPPGTTAQKGATPSWGALGGAPPTGSAPPAPNAAPARSGLSSSLPPPGK